MGTAVGQSALEARFVGRGKELQDLLALFDAARRQDRPQFVVVEGAAGIGKSRLLREFLSAARAATPAGTVLQGRCPATGRGLTNWALAEVLRRACGIGLDDPADVVGERFQRGVRHVLTSLALSPGDTDATIHALATSAGFVLPGNPFDRLEPGLVPVVVARAWGDLLAAYARRGGVILAIEDLHWAGSGVLDMLTGIAPKLEENVFVIATARPAFREANAAFLTGHDIRWIELPQLSEDAAGELIGGLLPEASITSDARASIVAQAEGNPYFLEETVQHMIESGALVLDGSTWRRSGQAQSVTVPDSIQWVLAARIESLPVAERRILREAAVVGRVFWEGPIRAILADAGIGESLRRLAERGLVLTRPASTLSGQVEFAFKHALLRDAAYETMDGGHRARSHAAVGAWFAKIAGERTDELAELIAEHLRLAIEADPTGRAWDADRAEGETVRREAVRQLIAAGAAAHRRFAIDKAVELHTAAARLARSDGDRAEALAALAQDYESGLRGPESLDAYRQAIDVAERAGLPDDSRARIHVGAARLLSLRWGSFPARPDPAEIDAVVDAGLRLADDAETRCWLLVFKGAAGIRWRTSERPDPRTTDERLQATTAAFEGGRRLGLPELSSTAARIQSQLEFSDGRYADARKTMRAVIPDLERIGPLFLRALTSAYVVLSLTDLEGMYDEGLTHARRSLELGRRLSPHEHMHGTFMTLWCLYNLGEWSAMPPFVEEHVEALRGQDAFVCPYMRAGPLVGALAQAHLGKREEAMRLAALVEPSKGDEGLPEALIARLRVAMGDATGGAEIARRMLASGREAGLEENDHESLALVEALTSLEDWDGLRAFLPDARLRAGGLGILGPICDRAEAMAAVADHDMDRAAALLRRASAWFELHGVRYELARTRAILAGALPGGDHLLADAIETAEALYGDSASKPETERAPRPTAGALTTLTARELEVLRLVAAGHSNEAVATTLSLSLRTVERHLSNVYLKLDLSGRTARVAAVAALARLDRPVSEPPDSGRPGSLPPA